MTSFQEKESSTLNNDPFIVDWKIVREERQRLNNSKVAELISKNYIAELLKTINTKELDRVLKEVNLTSSELFSQCRNNDVLKTVLSGRISKNATRQGTKDEDLQISTCNHTSEKRGIFVENLSATAYRPTKTGFILTAKELKEQSISKDECLKSFDGKISGKINGWIFAKVVYGSGGHQDNVFEEADTICEWIVKYRDISEFFVILIDTDLQSKFDTIKNKYKHAKNIIVVNHIDFQKYIIQNF